MSLYKRKGEYVRNEVIEFPGESVLTPSLLTLPRHFLPFLFGFGMGRFFSASAIAFSQSPSILTRSGSGPRCGLGLRALLLSTAFVHKPVHNPVDKLCVTCVYSGYWMSNQRDPCLVGRPPLCVLCVSSVAFCKNFRLNHAP